MRTDEEKEKEIRDFLELVEEFVRRVINDTQPNSDTHEWLAVQSIKDEIVAFFMKVS